MFLEWDDWKRAPNWISEMDSVIFGGMNFTVGILWPAMRRLCASLQNGSVFAQGQQIVAANAPIGFSNDNLVACLKDGQFMYRHGFPGILLEIHGIELNDPDFKAVFGRGDMGKNRIYLNFHRIIEWSQEAAQGGGYPQNAIGQVRLDVVVGSVVLHEVLHNHKFDHPAYPHIDYDPTHPYFRSFPEVAEAAYLRAHADVFQDSSPPLGLTSKSGTAPLVCGTHR
jgi:hypothetical protein